MGEATLVADPDHGLEMFRDPGSLNKQPIFDVAGPYTIIQPLCDLMLASKCALVWKCLTRSTSLMLTPVGNILFDEMLCDCCWS